MTALERHVVVIENGTDDRLLVVENGEKSLLITGGDKRIEVSMVTAVGGGSVGTNQIAGVPVAFDDLANGDVLAYNGSNFANKRQVELTDGGNF